eukprot:2190316-Amphidinium_carterae.1
MTLRVEGALRMMKRSHRSYLHVTYMGLATSIERLRVQPPSSDATLDAFADVVSGMDPLDALQLLENAAQSSSA